jgi:hypothetical protein
MSLRSLRLAPLLAATLLAGACQSGGPTTRNNALWKPDSLKYRIGKRFFGYRPDVDGHYIDFQYQKKQDINLTLRRHFLNNNPHNPMEADDPSLTQRRPPHSLLPDVYDYLHVESLFTGVVTLAWSGAFLPIPIDSVMTTVFGGQPAWSEFGHGVAGTFTGKGDAEAQTPPLPSEFRVKNR